MHWPVIALLMASCAAPPAQAPSKPTLKISGSAALTGALLPALAHTHESTFNTMTFEIESTDSSDGLKALLRGDVDIAAVGTTRIDDSGKPIRSAPNVHTCFTNVFVATIVRVTFLYFSVLQP